jgi:CDP-L-myo-inositol myo-inositolphosphotransferase
MKAGGAAAATVRGLVVATLPAEGGAPLRALLRIGGITLLERQVRILRKSGARRILVVTAGPDAAIRAEIDRLAPLKLDVRQVWPGADGTLDAKDALTSGDRSPWLLLDGSSLFDDRLSRRLLEADGERVPLVPADRLAPADREPALVLDGPAGPRVFVGIARLAPERVRDLRPSGGGAWLRELLALVLREPGAAIDVASLPTYHYDLRRHEPYLFMPIARAADNPRAKRALLDAAQKSVLDWPAWYIHRPIEKWIVYHICEWPVTPNQITVLNNVVAYLATYCFATGAIWPAMAAALSVGVIDGLDGKQARTKVMTSELGRYEELLDKIYENSWFLAMAYHLAGQGHAGTAYALFFVILGTSLADLAVGETSRRRLRIQLDDAGPFERAFRVVSGRRNVYLWTLVPFLFFDAFYEGYWMIAVYSTLTLVVRLWRLLANLSHPGALERSRT